MSLILPDSNQTNVQGPKWLNHGQWGATGKSKFSTINSPTVKAKVSDLPIVIRDVRSQKISEKIRVWIEFLYFWVFTWRQNRFYEFHPFVKVV